MRIEKHEVELYGCIEIDIHTEDGCDGHGCSDWRTARSVLSEDVPADMTEVVVRDGKTQTHLESLEEVVAFCEDIARRYPGLTDERSSETDLLAQLAERL